jgi:hypothetical protein
MNADALIAQQHSIIERFHVDLETSRHQLSETTARAREDAQQADRAIADLRTALGAEKRANAALRQALGEVQAELVFFASFFCIYGKFPKSVPFPYFFLISLKFYASRESKL